MFEYGESLSEKSNLELEALAYLDNRLSECKGVVLSNGTVEDLALELIHDDFEHGYLKTPFEEKGWAEPVASQWIKRHWDDLAELDNNNIGFQDMVYNPMFNVNSYHPICSPTHYRLYSFQRLLISVLSSPELEFLIDEKSGKLEVTPEIISKVEALHEEHLSEMEQDLRSPHAHARIRAEELGGDYRYPLNPKMPVFDRLEVLAFGSEDRRFRIAENGDYDMGLTVRLTKDFINDIKRVNNYLDRREAIGKVALGSPFVLQALPCLPEPDLKKLINQVPKLSEKVFLPEHVPDRSSNSLSDLAQEARSASDALNKESDNRLDREHEER